MVRDKNYTYHREHLVMHSIVQSLYCTPETYMILSVSYTSIKKIMLRAPLSPFGCGCTAYQLKCTCPSLMS